MTAVSHLHAPTCSLTRRAALRQPVSQRLHHQQQQQQQHLPRRPCRQHSRTAPVCMASSLQFVKGVDEPCIPDIKLTRSKDGSSGTATFTFKDPAIFEEQEELGDITGLYMTDDEGTIQTVEVSAKFVNGKPDRIEALYIMKGAGQWDRFMRFMDNYAEDHGLGFNKKK